MERRAGSKTSEIISRTRSQNEYLPILRENLNLTKEGFFTSKQIVIGLCLGQMWIGTIGFLFSYYGQRLPFFCVGFVWNV